MPLDRPVAVSSSGDDGRVCCFVLEGAEVGRYLYSIYRDTFYL
jgi:hypothetical protein